MKDVVFIGNLAYQNEVTLGGKNVEHFVGSAYFTSFAAQLISKNIGVVARVGEDYPLNRIAKIVPDISGVVVVHGEKTARFFVKETKTGLVFSEKPGVSSTVQTNKYPKSFYNTHFIHLASMLPKIQLEWINCLRKMVAKQTIISADAFEPYIIKYPKLTLEVLSKVDLAFINEKEYTNLREYAYFSLSHPYILKLGPRGAIYIDGKKKIIAKAPKVKAVNAIGAGEVLAAVFLTLRAKGISIEKSLRAGVNIASYSVEEVGILHLLKNKKVQKILTPFS